VGLEGLDTLLFRLTTRFSVLLLSTEQGLRLAANSRQLELQYVPDNAMVNPGVTVDENVPEGDDPLMFTDAGGSRWIGSG